MVAYALVGALVLVVVSLVVLADRKDARCHQEREADRAERAVLLQRIQAPEAAVYEHATRYDHEPDEDGMPMTDRMVADEESRRALERLQRMESEEFEGRRL